MTVETCRACPQFMEPAASMHGPIRGSTFFLLLYVCAWASHLFPGPSQHAGDVADLGSQTTVRHSFSCFYHIPVHASLNVPGGF